MNSLASKNLIGRAFFRFSDLRSLDINRYFDCMRAIKPLLVENADFKNSTSDFYINRISNEDDGVSVRLVYFTNDAEKTKSAINQFILVNHEIALFFSQESTDGVEGNAAGESPEEESRFRTFTTVYTRIELDLLEHDILSNFRKIVSEYMQKLSKSRENIYAESFFNQFLNEYSDFFRNELDNLKRKQLWEDLKYCPRGALCCPHMLANMFAVSDTGQIFC